MTFAATTTNGYYSPCVPSPKPSIDRRAVDLRTKIREKRERVQKNLFFFFYDADVKRGRCWARPAEALEHGRGELVHPGRVRPGTFSRFRFFSSGRRATFQLRPSSPHESQLNSFANVYSFAKFFYRGHTQMLVCTNKSGPHSLPHSSSSLFAESAHFSPAFSHGFCFLSLTVSLHLASPPVGGTVCMVLSHHHHAFKLLQSRRTSGMDVLPLAGLPTNGGQIVGITAFNHHEVRLLLFFFSLFWLFTFVFRFVSFAYLPASFVFLRVVGFLSSALRACVRALACVCARAHTCMPACLRV